MKKSSIDLKKTEEEDEIEDGDDESDIGEELRDISDKRASNIWEAGGPQKEKVVNKLIKCFGSLVIRQEIEDGHDFGQYSYIKSPKASRNVLSLRVTLKQNENYDWKYFTIYIAEKKWVDSELRPLMELCAEECAGVGFDRDLAMRCCRLVLVLIKSTRDAAKKLLENEIKLHKKEETMAESVLRVEKERKHKENAVGQMRALLSFKEALCTEKCLKAITLVFADALSKERTKQQDATKEEVAVCISYLRRMLSIDAKASCASASDVIHALCCHHKFIVNATPMLSAIPAMCAEITQKYHDDWLGDIVLILYFSLRGFTAKDLFQSWRSSIVTAASSDLEELKTKQPGRGRTGDVEAVSANYTRSVPSAVGKATSGRPSGVGGGSSGPPQRRGILGSLMDKERQARSMITNTRHSRFGGAFRLPPTASSLAPSTAPMDATSSSLSIATNGVGGASDGANPLKGAVPTATRGAPLGRGEQGKGQGQGQGTTDEAKAMDDQDPSTRVLPPVSLVVSCPFNVEANHAKRKRSKKNLAFVNMDPHRDLASSASMEQGGEAACAVVATMVNTIVDSNGLAMLVHRVNDDLRRGESRIGQEAELSYYETLGRMLYFHRLKLAHVKQQLDDCVDVAGAALVKLKYPTVFDHGDGFDDDGDAIDEGSSSNVGTSVRWIPNMRNVMSALDKMSFNRVVYSVKTLNEKVETAADAFKPLELYKEMICYIRVLLESENSDHNEIASGLLFPLFFARKDRTDPLPEVLSKWKPGVYPRQHLNILAELVHETLKTLEAARKRFQHSDFGVRSETVGKGEKKQKKPKSAIDMDTEQYISACVGFSIDDYFRRLVTTRTVELYIRLLENYNTNDAAINHYVYCFLQRMKNFALEQPIYAPPPNLPPSGASSSGAVNDLSLGGQNHEGPNLGFMLYSIRTMMVFDAFMNDPRVQHQERLAPLLRLVKSIFRSFQDCSRKNPLLFVESLFSHPQQFSVTLDNVYEASAYISSALGPGKGMGDKGNGADKGRVQGSWEDQPTRRIHAGGSDESDRSEDEDEFDENDPVFLAALAASAKTRGPKGSKSSKAAAVAAAAMAGGSKRSGQDAGKTKPTADGRKGKRLRRRSKGGDESASGDFAAPVRRSRRSLWSDDDDTKLRELYAQHKGKSTVFSLVSNSLKEMGLSFSQDQVSKRVRELRLHAHYDDSDDEEVAMSGGTSSDENNESGSDANGDSEEESSARRTTKKQKRAPVKTSTASSNDAADSDNEDVDFGASPMALQRGTPRGLNLAGDLDLDPTETPAPSARRARRAEAGHTEGESEGEGEGVDGPPSGDSSKSAGTTDVELDQSFSSVDIGENDIDDIVSGAGTSAGKDEKLSSKKAKKSLRGGNKTTVAGGDALDWLEALDDDARDADTSLAARLREEGLDAQPDGRLGQKKKKKLQKRAISRGRHSVVRAEGDSLPHKRLEEGGAGSDDDLFDGSDLDTTAARPAIDESVISLRMMGKAMVVDDDE